MTICKVIAALFVAALFIGQANAGGGSSGPSTVIIGANLPSFASTPTFNIGTIAGIATAANQTNGAQKTMIVDGAGAVIASTSNNLNVQCANCTGSGVSATDAATFTASTSLFAGAGGFFQTTPTSNALTNGKQGMFQATANRALFTNLRDAAGTEVGTAGAPIRTDPTGATPQPVSGTVTVNSGTVTANAGTNLNTSALATSANQTSGTQKTQIIDGVGAVIASTSNNLNVQCANCSGSGVSTADAATFTPSTSLFAGGGGFFQTTPTANALTTGQQGTFQVTANRALFTNLRNAAGTEVGTSGAPIRIDPVGTTAQPVNISLFNGITPLMGNGISGTGAQRVAIASDNSPFSVNLGTIGGAATAAKQPALGTAGTASADVQSVQGIAGMTKLLVTPDSVALPANQSMNVSQFNGVTPLMGNGVAGTGAQRVAIASDNTAFSVNANAGTNLNTSALATSANLTSGTQKTQIVDSIGAVIASTSNNLNVQCANCSGSGVSTADAASFTAGASLFAGSGALFQTTPTNNPLTNGQQGMLQATANRALFSNLRNAAGTEVGTFGAPIRTDPVGTTMQPVNVSQFNGVAPLMGNGIAGTGAQRVTIASDNTAFSVNAAAAQSGTWTVQPGNTANTTAWKVDGSAVTQPMSVASLPALPANQSMNVSQFNGVTPLMGNGVAGTGAQRVTVASDNTAFSVNLGTIGGAATAAKQPALGTAGTASADVITVQGKAGMTAIAVDASATAVQGTSPGTAAAAGSTIQVQPASLDPCQTRTRIIKSISITTAANTKINTSAITAKKFYICSLALSTAGANNIAIVSGTGTNCATGTAGVYGGATAANGANLVANQPFKIGTGGSAVAASATAGDDFCLITSAATPVAGSVAWAEE